jgi:hypothetical protein
MRVNRAVTPQAPPTRQTLHDEARVLEAERRLGRLAHLGGPISPRAIARLRIVVELDHPNALQPLGLVASVTATRQSDAPRPGPDVSRRGPRDSRRARRPVQFREGPAVGPSRAMEAGRPAPPRPSETPGGRERAAAGLRAPDRLPWCGREPGSLPCHATRRPSTRRLRRCPHPESRRLSMTLSSACCGQRLRGSRAATPTMAVAFFPRIVGRPTQKPRDSAHTQGASRAHPA